jgi:hypothetical protein
MAESEELNLVVKLDDQASAQLQRIQNQLRDLGRTGGPADDSLRRLHERTRNVTGGMRDLEGMMRNVGMRAGIIGGVIGGVVDEFARLGAERGPPTSACAVVGLTKTCQSRPPMSAVRDGTQRINISFWEALTHNGSRPLGGERRFRTIQVCPQDPPSAGVVG